MSDCQGRKIEPKIEYVPIHDTTVIEKERIVEKTKPVFITDTLIKVDSVYVGNDGTYVELPMKWSQYRDTIKKDSSEIKVAIDYHGIEAGIDKVNLDYTYNKEIQTVVIPPKRWNIGVTVGPYVGFGAHGNIQ